MHLHLYFFYTCLYSKYGVHAIIFIPIQCHKVNSKFAPFPYFHLSSLIKGRNLAICAPVCYLVSFSMCSQRPITAAAAPLCGAPLPCVALPSSTQPWLPDLGTTTSPHPWPWRGCLSCRPLSHSFGTELFRKGKGRGSRRERGGGVKDIWMLSLYSSTLLTLTSFIFVLQISFPSTSGGQLQEMVIFLPLSKLYTSFFSSDCTAYSSRKSLTWTMIKTLWERFFHFPTYHSTYWLLGRDRYIHQGDLS